MYQNNFGQQGFQQQQANRYQPVGFVQSQYQGIPRTQQQSFTSNYGASSQPVISHVGYTAGNASQGFGQSQQFGSGISHTSYNPVISHVGSSAGQSFNYQSHGPVQAQTQNFNPVISHLGTSVGQQFSGGYQSGQSSQPVISHVGFTAGQDASRSQFSSFPQQQSFTNNFASQNAQTTSYNPVIQATAQQQQSAGPVISHVGYSAGSQQSGIGMGFNSQQRF